MAVKILRSFYVDDILVFSDSIEEHVVHLRAIFSRLQMEGFHLRLSKCSFAKEEVEFLGHKLSSQGLSTSPHKLDSLNAWKSPLKTPKQVRQFLGLIIWYRAFIPHLATIAAPLFPLSSSKRLFQWSESATQAMEALKNAVISAPCLARWECDRDTRVITDASKVGIGAVLEQLHEKGWRPISFWSRRLSDPETRYSTTDREWLGVVEAVSRRWRGFLEDKPFLVCSDHAALSRKLHKSSHDPPLNDRQCRWVEALMPFPFTYQYIQGSQNVVADALSRCPTVANSVTLVRSLLVGLLEYMRLAAQYDPAYQELVKRAQKGQDNLWVEEGLVREKGGIWWVPENNQLHTLLLVESHDSPTSGHFGIEKTKAILVRRWKWTGLSADVEAYVNSCVVCQKAKHSTQKPPGLLHPIVASEPGQIVTLDFVSKFTPADKTKHDQCLFCIDKFSKFTFLQGCLSSIDAPMTARLFLKRVIPILGVPQIVISDRGPQFSAQFWKELLNALGAKAALATSHHPQTDGQSERGIQTFLRLIRTFASNHQSKWEEFLPLFELSINSVPAAATGFSPFEILFGRIPKLPRDFICPTNVAPDKPHDSPDSKAVALHRARWLSIWELVKNKQADSASKMKQRFDHGRRCLDL